MQIEMQVATATASFQRHIHDRVLSSLKMEFNNAVRIVNNIIYVGDVVVDDKYLK
jgi:hypothetical protein